MTIPLNANLIVALCFLIVFTIFDFLTFNNKKKSVGIPSFLTTLFLIAMLILGGFTGLYLGVLASLIALLFTDLELWGGIADFKIFVAGAMAFPDIMSMLIYATIVSIVAVGVKAVILFKITKGKQWKFPFIPVMLIAYVIAWVLIR